MRNRDHQINIRLDEIGLEILRETKQGNCGCPVLLSALAGITSALPLVIQKPALYAGEINELKQKHLPFGKMMNVQVITKPKKGDALWQKV